MITSFKHFYINEQLKNIKWYHGSKNKFSNFKLNKEISNNLYGNTINDQGLGVFFTNNIVMAKWFAGVIDFDGYEYVDTNTTGYIYECIPLISNPFVLNEHVNDIDEDDAGQTYFDFINKYDNIDTLRKYLLSNNYDSLLVNDVTTNYYEDGTYSILIVLDPNKIKINKIHEI